VNVKIAKHKPKANDEFHGHRMENMYIRNKKIVTYETHTHTHTYQNAYQRQSQRK